LRVSEWLAFFICLETRFHVLIDFSKLINIWIYYLKTHLTFFYSLLNWLKFYLKLFLFWFLNIFYKCFTFFSYYLWLKLFWIHW
jgi:hypothetical protein